MKIIKGDLLEQADKGEFDMILHGCNCFHTWGSGIAKALKSKWYSAYLVDKLGSSYGDATKLGSYTYADVTTISGDYLTIVNCYTQVRYGREKQHFQYSALETVLDRLRVDFHLEDYRIGYPLIGGGLGKGDPEIIKAIFEEKLKKLDHTLVEYLRGW